MKTVKIVTLQSLVIASAVVAPAAFAAGDAIDTSSAIGYVTGALVAVAALGAAYLGLDSLKKVWSKITATRV